LVFDNYTVVPRSSDALPAASYSRKTSVVEFIEGSSSAAQNEDLDELRQQLQSMKKQALVIMEQSRRSPQREKLALQQAQEALALKETAVTESAEATSRENYVLQLMNDSSLYMTGTFFELGHI
jgi:tRNA U34 5-carboxymethylaminomethyl modifying GTPase MnmE/TrmE